MVKMRHVEMEVIAMIITGKLISLAIIVASVPVGLISYYIMSPLDKVKKKQYIEELTSQIISFVVFIWVAKIILNFSLFIRDPIVVLTYPSNSQAFYLAILFSALLLLYKAVTKKINLLPFIESGVFVFLVTSFTYELIQIVVNKDPFTFGYLVLLAVLLCLFFLVSERIKTSTLISMILVGWSVGMLFLVYKQPFATVFGYLMKPWFIWVIFITGFLFFIITRRKRVFNNGWN